MLLRIRREIFKVGEFENYQEEGLRTRDELCYKYNLDRDTTQFFDGRGTLLEDDLFDTDVLIAIQTPAATAAVVAFSVILAVGLIAAGAIVISNLLNKVENLNSRKLTYSNSLRGATNPIRKNGQIGVLLGKYSVPGDVAGLVYSSYEPKVGESAGTARNDQYIHQMFGFGYQSSVLMKDSRFVNSGNPDGYVIRMGDSPIDIYKDISISNGTDNYSKRCVEEGLSMKMIGPAESGDQSHRIARTSPTNTVRIGVGICAPYGYYELNDDAEQVGTTMNYIVRYREHGTESWNTLARVNKSVNADTYRVMHEITVAKGQYDVEVERLNEDSKESKYNDTIMVELIQFDTVGINDNPAPVIHPDKYRLLSIKVKATDQLNGYLDQIYADCFLKCRTMTSEGVWSVPDNPTEVGTMNNPASILLYLLTDPDVNPRAISDDKIDWVSLNEWWHFCDERKWSVNAWITENVTISELIKNVCTAGRANFQIINGKYGVLIEQDTQATTQMFTPRNAWDMNETRAFESQPNLLKIAFLNDSTGEEEERVVYLDENDVVHVDRAENIQEDRYDSESLTLWGITNPEQIAQLGIYHLASLHALTRAYTWSASIDSIHCSVGDIVYLANDMFLYSLGYGRIVSVDKDDTGKVTGVYIDEGVGIDSSKNYGITVRLNDGTFKSIPVDQDSSDSYHLLFKTPVEGAVMEGNLFSYGEGEGKRVVIKSIEADNDLNAKISAVDYIPELYDMDINTPIPEYVSSISKYGSGVNIGVGGSGRPEFDPPVVVPPLPATLTLALTSHIYHYNFDGILTPGTEPIKAIASLSNSTEPLVWLVNDTVIENAGSQITIGPDYMIDRDFITIQVSAGLVFANDVITRVTDGRDYPPIVEYKYSTDMYNPPVTYSLFGFRNSVIGFDVSVFSSDGYSDTKWSKEIPRGSQYIGMYLWKRTWSYELHKWMYERVTGENGMTISTSRVYGLSTSPTEHNIVEWSDTVPTWYMGYYVWYKYKYTNLSNGSVSYSENAYYDSTMTDTFVASSRFEFTASSLTFEQNRRSADNNSIVLEPVIKGYDMSSTPILWETVPAFTVADNILAIPKKAEVSQVTVRMYCFYMGNEVSFSLTLSAIDKTTTSTYLGKLDAPPTEEAFGILLEGDYYLGMNNIPYRYNGSEWLELTGQEDNYAEIMAVTDADVYKDPNAVVPVASAHYLRAKHFYGSNATIDNLTTEDLQLRETAEGKAGKIRSFGYEKGDIDLPEEKPGFYIDQSGYSEICNLRAKAIDATGLFKCDTLETVPGIIMNSTVIKDEYKDFWQHASSRINTVDCPTGHYKEFIGSSGSYDRVMTMVNRGTSYEDSFSSDCLVCVTTDNSRRFTVHCSTNGNDWVDPNPLITSASDGSTVGYNAKDNVCNYNISNTYAIYSYAPPVSSGKVIISKVFEDKVYLSYNGIDWKRYTNSGANLPNIYYKFFLNNRFIGVSTEGREDIYGADADGLLWGVVGRKPMINGSRRNMMHMAAYGNNLYMCVFTSEMDYNYSSTASQLAFSSDLTNWTVVSDTNINNKYIYSISFGKDKFIVTTSTGIYFSVDGNIWSKVSDKQGQVVTYSKSLGMFVGNSQFSADGLTWTLFNNDINDATSLFCCDIGGRIYYSDSFSTRCRTMIDYTLISNFFASVKPKMIPGKSQPVEEPLLTGGPVSCTVSNPPGSRENRSEVSFIKATPTELVFRMRYLVGIESGYITYRSLDVTYTPDSFPPSWAVEFFDMDITESEPLLLVDKVIPKTNRTNIGSPQRLFYNGYFYNIEVTNADTKYVDCLDINVGRALKLFNVPTTESGAQVNQIYVNPNTGGLFLRRS